MTPQESRARWMAELDELQARRDAVGYLSKDVTIRIGDLRDLLSALDAAERVVQAARPSEDDGLIDTSRLYRALAAYDAATTAKEGADHGTR